jgi:lambda family phage portal protein
MSILNTVRQKLARAILPPLHRSYEGATGGRRWNRQASHGAWGSEAHAAVPVVRARARHFAVNNSWANNGVAAWTTALIGAGIVPASQHPNATTRKKLAKAFKAWVSKADADSLTDFYGLQASIVRSVVIDGESFIQILDTASGPKLRLIPSEAIDSNYTVSLSESRYIVAGIEFDAEGTRLAYHVNRSEIGSLSTSRIRVPAESMLHIFVPSGPSAVRGVSWLAPVLLTLGEFDQLSDALLVGAKVAAMHAGFITDINGTAGIPYDGQQSGNVLEGGIAPGTLKVLPSGFDIKFNSPQQAAQSNEFASMQLRSIAAGLGLPEFMLSGDMRSANFSSMRSALVSFRQRVEQIQFQTLVPQLMRPVWERFILWQTLIGEIAASEFDAACEAEFYPPAQPWVDPLKDAEAIASQIEAGLMSRRQAVAALGYSIDDLDSEIASDKAREKTLGLSFGESAKQKTAPIEKKESADVEAE